MALIEIMFGSAGGGKASSHEKRDRDGEWR